MSEGIEVVVMCGGFGKRLDPYTRVLPKPLLPLGDMPILQIVLDQIASQGFTRTCITTGYKSELVRRFVGDGSQFGLVVTYYEEKEPLGTAGALRHILNDLAEKFVVINGDLLTDFDFGAAFKDFLASSDDAQIAAFTRHEPIDYGVLDIDANGMLQQFREKPRLPMLVSMGVNFLSKAAISDVFADSSYIDMPDLLLELKSRGRLVGSVEHTGFWFDIGRPSDFEVASEFVVKNPSFFGKCGL